MNKILPKILIFIVYHLVHQHRADGANGCRGRTGKIIGAAIDRDNTIIVPRNWWYVTKRNRGHLLFIRSWTSGIKRNKNFNLLLVDLRRIVILILQRVSASRFPYTYGTNYFLHVPLYRIPASIDWHPRYFSTTLSIPWVPQQCCDSTKSYGQNLKILRALSCLFPRREPWSQKYYF